MTRLLAVTAIASILVGLLGGSCGGDSPIAASRASFVVCRPQLKSERLQREAAESDLLREKAQSD